TSVRWATTTYAARRRASSDRGVIEGAESTKLARSARAALLGRAIARYCEPTADGTDARGDGREPRVVDASSGWSEDRVLAYAAPPAPRAKTAAAISATGRTGTRRRAGASGHRHRHRAPHTAQCWNPRAPTP